MMSIKLFNQDIIAHLVKAGRRARDCGEAPDCLSNIRKNADTDRTY